MAAISDATALICLAKISELPLLEALGAEIIIAQSVMDEIDQKDDGVSAQIRNHALFSTQSALNRKLFEELTLFLDPGESESIIIAKERNIPLLIDERKGRVMAQEMGVKVIGTVGLIALAFKKGHIDSSKAMQIYESLEGVGFRTTEGLKQWLMRMVGLN